MLAALIAAEAALGLPARTFGLYVGGLDLIKNAASGYGAPIESIELTEAAAGQVSGLKFTVDDPLSAIDIATGAPVLLMDIARDVPLFAGWVDVRGSATLAGTGRSFSVTCVGIDAVLDWLFVPGQVTWAVADNHYDVVQRAAAAAIGIGVPLNVASAAGSPDLAHPVSHASTMNNAGTAGEGTLRAVLQTIGQAADASAAAPIVNTWKATVDWWGGLRTFTLGSDQVTGRAIGGGASDFVASIILSTAGPIRPSGLQHSEASGDAVRQVYVKGGNVAGSGVFTDGSGIPGPTAKVSDSNSLTAAAAAAIAAQYLGDHGGTASGSVAIEGGATVGSPASHVVAYATMLRITDASQGLASALFYITELRKSWSAGGAEELWLISYGARLPTAAQYLRQLTGSALV
jgi:hypothetical protein